MRGRTLRLAAVVTVALSFAAVVAPAPAAERVRPEGFCDGSALPAVGEGSASQVTVHAEVFSRAYAAACRRGSSVSYLGTGDARGLKVVLDRLLPSAFGASDVAMTPAEKILVETDANQFRQRYSPVLQIPLYVDAIAIAYNIPCRVPPVRFRSQTLSLIYSGLVTRWDDDSLVQDNPGLESCHETIRLTKRADVAGSTMVFKDYLSKRNPQWQRYRVQGANQLWPTLRFACSGGGNEGMGNCVRSFRGALGYVQLATARAEGLSVGMVENLSGTFVEPSARTCSAAADSAVVPPGIPSVGLTGLYMSKPIPSAMGDWSTVSIADAPDAADGSKSYPVCTFSFIFIFYAPANGYAFILPYGVMRTIVDYLWVGLRDTTQARLNRFGFAPLPPKILAASREGVLAITYFFNIP